VRWVTVNLYYAQAQAAQIEKYAHWCTFHRVEAPPILVDGCGLWFDDGGLALLSAAAPAPFYLTPQMFLKRQRGQSLLAQACGLSKRHRKSALGLTVLDPFAGFGLDAFVLAHLGCEVLAVEQERMIWLMLCDYAHILDIKADIICADAHDFLECRTAQWDVVYLDPMFEARQKRALPNLGLQHLQFISGKAEVDVEGCLAGALRVAKQRVVLKRRRKDPVSGTPSFQLKGQAVRFDVYVC